MDILSMRRRGILPLCGCLFLGRAPVSRTPKQTTLEGATHCARFSWVGIVGRRVGRYYLVETLEDA